MEGKGSGRLLHLGNGARKKRSNASRRPHDEPQPAYNYMDMASSTPPPDNFSEASVDKNVDYGIYPHKEINLKQFTSSASCNNVADAGESQYASMHSSCGGNEQMRSATDSNTSGECALAPANSEVAKGAAHHPPLINENKVKKVKLKVGGMTRTIHATSDGVSVIGSSSTMYCGTSDITGPGENVMLEDGSSRFHSLSSDKASRLRGVPWWKNFSASGFNMGKADSSGSSESVRKSKRVPKKRAFDGADGADDYEILGKVNVPRLNEEDNDECDEDYEGGRRRQQKLSEVLKRQSEGPHNVNSRTNVLSAKEARKSKSGRTFEDDDYLEEEEPTSDVEPIIKRKKDKMARLEPLAGSERETTVITRQRALRSGKDTFSGRSADMVKLPIGLPPAPPKKQKDMLSEVDRQLKKAEAAERRRMQAEKAAMESQAEAIRKILGQDSSRKKREQKIRKRQEEEAEEKAAKSMTIKSDTVRWVMGPARTVVTFPEEMGLPSIFDSRTCSYPPPREKCAAPSCTNPYRYRDSKSKLPLCSLDCYRAIQRKAQPLVAC
ncbi:uncharacterized protein LOC115751221 [Rhodamnia argentea]|uniref:Uncharacterized protein LOC115751221 n=1 Tax=Rhodamnia argentea TaxID=178133 RepID=A0A8B8QE85_9MYRT|nr:uncharacterized protein LOC115751221 [Rhodamnia argentea]XP_030544859.1 uncharacterized protein LOC115751221 [Rhodamnia argentea]XP_030544860.1 uncharacterized protein LOC115751221 [Rhodamnia argentea]